MLQNILIVSTMVGIVLIVYSMKLFDEIEKQLLEVFSLDKSFHTRMISRYRNFFRLFVVGYVLELLSAIQGYSGVNSKFVVACLLFSGAIFAVVSVRFQMRLLQAVMVARMQQTDELTGLLNKRAFESKVSHSMSDHEDAYLLVMDLDNFKTINDKFGHMAGDEAIKSAATILRNTFRQEDTIGRFGGDEFVAYLYDWDSVELSRCLNKINNEMKEWSKNCFDGIEASFSIGVARQNEQMNYKELFNNADEAMYKAKDNGKACYFVSK